MESEYLIQGFNNSRVTAYLDYIVNISVALGAERSVSRKEFNDSMLFEIKLANVNLFTNIPISKFYNGYFQVTDSNLVTTNTSKPYTMITVKTLNEKYPLIPWVDYINHLIANENIQIDINETVYVREIEFIPALEKLLKVTPKR